MHFNKSNRKCIFFFITNLFTPLLHLHTKYKWKISENHYKRTSNLNIVFLHKYLQNIIIVVDKIQFFLSILILKLEINIKYI